MLQLNLFRISFGNALKWTPPDLPKIESRIDGNRSKISIDNVKMVGLSKFLKSHHVFSYAIPSPNDFNFTSFGKISSPITS